MRKIALLIAVFCGGAGASVDPYMIENKVQLDLDSALSRVIPREKFFIQVSSEVSVQTERRLVEGETVTNGPPEEDSEEEANPMPGFNPETPAMFQPKRTSQNRETYRLIDTPQLTLVRVHVGLDENIRDDLSLKIRGLVQSYLSGNYPNRATVIFTRIPMLKPPPPPPSQISETSAEIERALDKLKEMTSKQASHRDYDETDRGQPIPRRDLSSENSAEGAAKYFPWIALGFACLCMLFLAYILRPKLRGEGVSIAMSPPGAPRPPRHRIPGESGPAEMASLNQLRAMKLAAEAKKNARMNDAKDEEDDEDSIEYIRNKFLDAILSRSDTFKLFFERLGEEDQTEIYAGLKGPAFDSFLEGMAISFPPESISDPNDLEEKVEAHYKKFREYARSKDWQDKQFFGFLGRLNEEQLMTLVHHESPLAVCAMLRFLKPAQSASLLDSVTPEKRAEIMGQVNLLQATSFSELAAMERKIRDSIARLPNHFFGSPKGDVAYWGAVLNEAQDQESILSEVEKTNPGIYPQLKKFKFKLDDLGSIPSPILKKILNETDNEELALALLTLPESAMGAALGVMTPQRKGFLEEQMASSRGASKERIMEARLTLTKRFREELV